MGGIKKKLSPLFRIDVYLDLIRAKERNVLNHKVRRNICCRVFHRRWYLNRRKERNEKRGKKNIPSSPMGNSKTTTMILVFGFSQFSTNVNVKFHTIRCCPIKDSLKENWAKQGSRHQEIAKRVIYVGSLDTAKTEREREIYTTCTWQVGRKFLCYAR